MSKKPDRHKPHSRQYNVRAPIELIAAFNDACRNQNQKPALVSRALMQGYVDLVAQTAAGGSQS